MNQVNISIIIPVYNTAQYLQRCLDSVSGQTLSDIEIICVHGTSKDNSGAILDEYAQKDARIKIFNEYNQGLSAARNIGIDAASGEYIYFLDSDDYIDNDYLERMFTAIKNSNTDMVMNLNIISEAEDKNHVYIHQRSKDVAPQGEYITREKAVSDTLPNVWTRLYKKSFLDKYNIRFPQGYICEDVYFHYLTHVYIDKTFVFKGSSYHYINRDSSLTKNTSDPDLWNMKIYDLIYDYFLQNNLLNKYEIKMFHIHPYFMVDTEEKFNFYRLYFQKTSVHFEIKKYLYNDLELFFINNIINTKNFKEYKHQFGTNVTLSFVRGLR
ncbi:glycosyl transferase [Spirochaetia bacterium]|nr:glycosyl transferase [Spirochaetia bacterium]